MQIPLSADLIHQFHHTDRLAVRQLLTLHRTVPDCSFTCLYFVLITVDLLRNDVLCGHLTIQIEDLDLLTIVDVMHFDKSLISVGHTFPV